MLSNIVSLPHGVRHGCTQYDDVKCIDHRFVAAQDSDADHRYLKSISLMTSLCCYPACDVNIMENCLIFVFVCILLNVLRSAAASDEYVFDVSHGLGRRFDGVGAISGGGVSFDY